MPRYMLMCNECSHEDDVLCLYDELHDHKCPKCGSNTTIQMSRPHLTGLPTPIHHGKIPMAEDKGFKDELDSIYKDDPFGTPGGTDD